MYSEFVLRFMRMEAMDSPQDPAAPYLLSEDKVLGLLRKPDDSRFISFGRFKLKSPRIYRKPIHIVNMYFKVDLLYRAMRIFRRRKRFEFGLYEMSNGEVFAIRERDDILLIAPAIFDGTPEQVIEFETLVTRINKSFFEKWKVWSRIIQGRKS